MVAKFGLGDRVQVRQRDRETERQTGMQTDRHTHTHTHTHELSRASRLIGIEINDFFVDVQNKMVAVWPW
jgi:hypothetical protein